MNEYYYPALGVYSPAFFRTDIRTDLDLSKLAELPDREASTFLHEYIHFLQDISTTFGLLNIFNISEIMKYFAFEIQQSSQSNVLVPLEFKFSKSHNIFENKQFMSVYFGSQTNFDTFVIDNFGTESTTIFLPKLSAKKDVDQIIIYGQNDGGSKKLKFGAFCLIESMAQLVQSLCYPNLEFSHLDCPYKVAEKVVDHIYPEFGENKLRVLALCDASLGSWHPGELFYKVLLDMRAKNWMPEEIIDIYNYCNNFIKINNNIANNLKTLYEQTMSDAIKGLSDYFTVDYFDDNKKYIELIILSAQKFRDTFPTFIVDLATGGPLNSNPVFLALINELGIPVTINYFNKTYFYHPQQINYNFQPYAFLAIKEVFNIFSGKYLKCGLKLECKLSCHEQGIQDYTDERCLNNPWERHSDALLCPFAQIWRMWGLIGKIPVTESDFE